MPKLLLKLRHLFPTRLPTHKEQLGAFMQEIIDTYEFPDEPSYRHSIASAIMQLGALTDRKPMRFFAKSMRKHMANQIAFLAIEEIRQAEKLKQGAATTPGELPPCPPKN